LKAPIRLVATLAIAMIAGALGAQAAEPAVESGVALPEADAPSAIRAALDPKGLRVKSGEAVVAELWVAKDLPASGDAAKKPGANYSGIADGALLGLIRFPEKWSDYRGKGVAAGAYTLRYLSQPVDGNHMGISEYIDYAVLVPAASDKDPAPNGDRKALYALSREASGRNHPAVLYLVPAGDAQAPSASVPAEGHIVLFAAPGGRTLGFTLRGRTDAEES